MDVGMVHCVPESMCTYKAICREAMESVMKNPQEQGGIVHDIITTQVIFMASKYTVIDVTSSKCRFRDTVDNPNVRIRYGA